MVTQCSTKCSFGYIMGAYASGLDRHSYKVKAGGSNPPVPTSCATNASRSVLNRLEQC